MGDVLASWGLGRGFNTFPNHRADSGGCFLNGKVAWLIQQITCFWPSRIHDIFSTGRLCVETAWNAAQARGRVSVVSPGIHEHASEIKQWSSQGGLWDAIVTTELCRGFLPDFTVMFGVGFFLLFLFCFFEWVRGQKINPSNFEADLPCVSSSKPHERGGRARLQHPPLPGLGALSTELSSCPASWGTTRCLRQGMDCLDLLDRQPGSGCPSSLEVYLLQPGLPPHSWHSGLSDGFDILVYRPKRAAV